MTPFQWVLLAGAVGTFVIIWQNWLSFQDTRVELENRLRDRLGGRGGKEGKIGISVDEIRIHKLSRWAKLKWYLGFGIDSSVEVKVQTNVHLTELVWEGVEEMFETVEVDLPEMEYLGADQSAEGSTSLSAIRINSTDESEIMQIVCAIPVVVDKMDLTFEIEGNQHPSPFNFNDQYQGDIEELMREYQE